MITFSDLCTLLLTFFVLILSMSSLNKLAYRASFRNFDSSVADRLFKEKEKAIVPRDAVIQEIIKSLNGVLELSTQEIEEAAKKASSEEDPSIVTIWEKSLWIRKDKVSGNFVLVFGEKLLFESGSADLVAEAHPVLDILGRFLHKSNYRAYIDGHTDNLPVTQQRFTSNNELSLTRAQAVLDFFTSRCGVKPQRLAMGGYGNSHPLADNKTAAGRALNRRVEIIFEW